jgi:HK97 family phage portal protein
MFGLKFKKRNISTNSDKYVIPAYIDRSGSGAVFALKDDIDSTSFAAIDMIASSFAGLSVGIFNRVTRQKVTDSPIAKVLRKPNLDDVRFIFWYSLAYDIFDDGNAFIFVAKTSGGDPISLFRLEPWRVTVARDETGRKIYEYNGSTYTSDNIIHVPGRWGYTKDGLRGYSIRHEAYKTFGLAQSIDDYTSGLYGNNLGQRTVIDISKAFPGASDEQIKQIRQKYINDYGGIQNAGKPIVKTNNIDFSVLASGLPEGRTQQLAENRKFQQSEILKIFGIPEAMIAPAATIDLEAVYTQFVERAVKPIATIFQESLENLFSWQEQDQFYIEYSYNSLLKTSLTNRIDSYSKQISNGILNPDEVRSKENLSPLPDGAGKTFFIPANLSPLNMETVNAYMATSKIKIEENEKNNSSPDAGSDKR